jgi:hypothetical protein
MNLVPASTFARLKYGRSIRPTGKHGPVISSDP